VTYTIICHDKAGASALRQENRPAHLAYLEAAADRLKLAGPLLDGDGNPKGSLLVVEAADAAEARRFAENDPYAKAGLFESVTITPFRPVLGGWLL